MATIKPDQSVLTLINTFEVEPKKCDELLRHLSEATEQVMRGRDGFVSANLHKSLDGRRVVNYAQWRDKQAFEAMLADPKAQAHMKTAGAMATSLDPVLYQVVATHEK